MSRPGRRWSSSSRPAASSRWACRTSTRIICSASSARPASRDRKSTRLNSSHLVISYAVFCLKKKNAVQKLAFTLSNMIEHLTRASETELAFHIFDLRLPFFLVDDTDLLVVFSKFPLALVIDG